jgi:hypothetical protein
MRILDSSQRQSQESEDGCNPAWHWVDKDERQRVRINPVIFLSFEAAFLRTATCRAAGRYEQHGDIGRGDTWETALTLELPPPSCPTKGARKSRRNGQSSRRYGSKDRIDSGQILNEGRLVATLLPTCVCSSL